MTTTIMTTRERFLRCNRFEPVDRVPNAELGAWVQTVDRWHGEGMPAEQVPKLLTLRGNDYLGLDCFDFVPIDIFPVPRFETEVIEQDERTVLYRDEEGTIRRALKEGQVGAPGSPFMGGQRMSMDQIVKCPVENRADFEEMKKRYDPYDPLRCPDDWDQRVEQWRTRDCPLALTQIGRFGLYSMLRRWMGTENACTVFYDDPALAEEMLDFMVEFFMQLVERALDEVTVDWFNWFEDYAFKTGPLVSPSIFKNFLLPRYQRVNEHLRARGIDIISLDTDGNYDVLMPLIIEAGFNHMWPLEQAAGMDAVRLRKEYGNKMALAGGIDKRVLTKGKKEIEEELLRQVPYLLETGGYIPTVDHSIPPDVPYENFLYYLDFKRRLIEGRDGA